MPEWPTSMLNRKGKISFFLGLLVFFSVSLPTFAQGEQSAQVLLDRMSHSFRELSYRGVFSYRQGEHMESFRIAHTVFNGEEYERLEYLDGEPREIIRRGHSLSCMHPGHQLVRLYQQQDSLKHDAQPGTAAVSSYYQFAITGDSRVAGRDAVEITVTPMDDHRFGYSLALDRDTGLLLRSSLIGASGEVLERFQFVEISIGMEIPMAYFQPGENSYHAGHSKPLEASADKPELSSQGRWDVNWLPGGFTATTSGEQIDGNDMQTYTDGLTVFSVFLEGVSDITESADGRAQKGATSAYSRSLLLDNHPYRVTVVGEIPHTTAKKVAKSVTLVDL
ncbi:MucB/RseB C-terminal domain-containing protein [Deltaproteobacteria bacterium]|nr:MucB/RseB C-terminal domain-containing protein [Deltaproteobacteria bacterium]